MNMISPRLNGILARYNDCVSSPDFIDMFAADDDDDNQKLVSEVNSDDILAMEIFPRLADSRTAIRCSAVSKRWKSLISAPEFIPNFLRHHRRPPSYAMFVEFRFRDVEEGASVHQWCSSNLIVEEGPKVTVGATDDYNLPQGLAFDSACDDFFLLSNMIDGRRRLYIRNAVSGQWFPLPDLPVKKQSGFAALVSHQNSTLSHYNYRVVYFTTIFRYGGRPVEYCTTVFSPETGKWSEVAASPLVTVPEKPDVVAANGLLYWIDTTRLALAIFDAFGGSWRFVDVPEDLLMPRELYRGLAPAEFCPPAAFYLKGSTEKWPHIGRVQGRVRISQLFGVGAGGFFFVLKIWELNDDNATWRLASEVQLRGPPPVGDGVTKWIYFFSFHPGDSDVVFLSCDGDVYSYCLSRGEYERVFTLSADAESIKKDLLARFAHILTVRLPAWPTKLPALPSFHL